MIRFFRAAVLALMLGPSAGTAQDFDAGRAAYQDGDLATALREWKPLAEQGDAIAQTLLGLMYTNGEGVAQDYAEAMKWYRLAAEQGNAEAQFNLGDMYLKGLGIPQDYTARADAAERARDQAEADRNQWRDMAQTLAKRRGFIWPWQR